MTTTTTNNRDAELHGIVDFTRGRDFFDPSQVDARVTIVGCGGIGSFAATALGKLGIQDLMLIDPDIVEVHNVPNQFFTLEAAHNKTPKVEALSAVINDFSVANVSTRQDRLENVDRYSGVVVSALDSMKARTSLWKKLRHNINVPLLIDARLGGQNIVIYTVDPRKPAQVKRYEETLYSDDEAQEAPCTARAVIDVGLVVGALITRTVRLYFSGQKFEHTLWYNQQTLTVMTGSD